MRLMDGVGTVRADLAGYKAKVRGFYMNKDGIAVTAWKIASGSLGAVAEVRLFDKF